MAATRVEAQQSDSKYEKVHGEQPQDIVFHNSRESARGVIFCDSKSHLKSKTFGQHSVETDMSQYRSESNPVVSSHNSSSEEQTTGNTTSENNKKNRDGKSVKNNSESNLPSDQNSKLSESSPNIQMYNMGLSRTNYHLDHRGIPSHMPSGMESAGLAQNPFSHLRPTRHSLHTSNAPSVSSRPVNTVSSFSPSGNVSNMQSKLFSGQSISQQTGPTPTLNQLLQASHPLQRHQNAYSELSKTGDQSAAALGPYHQMWTPHQPVPCNPHGIGYRGQSQSSPPRGQHMTPGGSASNYPQHLSSGTRQDPESINASGGSYGPLNAPQHPYISANTRYPTPGVSGAPLVRDAPSSYNPHSISPTFAHPQAISGSNNSSNNAPCSSNTTLVNSLQSGEQRTWNQSPLSLSSQPPISSGGFTQLNPHPSSSSTSSQSNVQSTAAAVPSSQLSPTQSSPTQSSPSRSSPLQHTPQFPPPHAPQNYHQQHTPPSPGSLGHTPQLSPQSSASQKASPQKHLGHQVAPLNPSLRPESVSDPPDVGDLTGQNSNDSTSGPGAPGTPNSQGMRPTPSPTGSTGSRSMSPAVGQQNIPMPPRPSSGQSDGSGPARMSHSPMATPGGYQQPLGPPHMHGAYKLGSHPPGIVPPSGPQMGPYTPPGQQYSQGNYSARPQGPIGNMQYGPTHGYSQQNPQGNSLGAGQYPNRPMPNHVPHTQFGGYQSWGGPGLNQGPPANAVGTPGNQMPPKGPGPGPGPGTGPQTPSASPQGTNASTGPRSLTPPHYLKQHLQQKMGYGTTGASIPPAPGGLQVSYGGSPSVPNSGVSVGPTPNIVPSMGPGSGIHHHGPGSMSSPMGPPTSGHLHPGMGPPAPNMGPPGPAGMGPGNAGMGPPSSGTSSSTNNAGPMSVSSPSTVLQGPQGPSLSTNAASPVPNSHHDGPMPPPISSSNSSLSHPSATGPVPGATHPEMNSVSESPHDNGIATTTTVAGTTTTNVTPATSGTVTSVVTTGPDGAPMDEGSQQSTLSNASQASGEDQSCTPKSRKDGSVVGGYHSHPPTPQSTVPSPGAASLNSVHEEYGDVNSPSWPRTPASPVGKPDSLSKLYEMDDNHERRMWLDKLLQFMEERGTPISACPTISKNPLDLFRLYLFVKERGGFMEVTKNKTWKDIAGLLGIGASSSAAYTLRKHYMKNLLAFECHFDRGGIDPQSIINQVEASSKKKGGKAASVPSPGSSNSQDSFPAAGSSGTSMDGFSYGYPPGSTPDFNTPPLQRPAAQTNAPSPHTGIQQGYQGQGGYSQYPQDQYGRSAPGSLGQDFNQQYSPSSSYPTNRGMYAPYGPDGDRNYSQGGSSNQPSAGLQQASTQDPYNRYMAPSQPPVYPARSGYGGPPAPPAGPNSQQPPPGTYPGQQDYYRQDQVYPGSQPPTTGGPGGQMYPGGPHNKSMPPPAPQPRRHPDFAKDQQPAPYPQYGQRQPVYGWSNNNAQFRGQFTPQGPVPQGPQQWPQGPPRPPGPPGSQPATNQWDRYPPSGQSAYQQTQQPQQQWVPGMATPGVGQSSPLRTSMSGPRGPYRPEGKPFPIATPPGGKGHSGGMPCSSQYPAQTIPKREIVFPSDSVEATMPVLYKRKRMNRGDVSPVEAWRLMMSLRSGLLAESCWALDVLNILLFDDSTVAYFGLAHMPGLLDVLLEHFRRSLVDMFDAPISISFLNNSDESGEKWYHHVKIEPEEVDLGSVTTPVDPDERVCILQSTTNYTLLTRKGEPVKVVNKESDIFVLDNRKVWDVDGDVVDENVTAELEQDPWQLATSDNCTTKYIVTCFQGEFGNVPFVRVLPYKRVESNKGNVPNPTENSNYMTESTIGEEATSLKSVKTECEVETDNASENSGSLNKDESQECLFSAERKKCDMKTRTNKSLSEVLSRIKEEPIEVNDILAPEVCEKSGKCEESLIIKEEPCGSSEQGIADVDSSSSKCEKMEDSSEDNVNGISFENGSNSNSNNSNDSEKINEEADTTSGSTQDLVLKNEERKDEESNESRKLLLNIRDPAGTLKRRRMSDYEDECYTRDEASLYLVTDTQDSLARRCVCLSNILRNLTFVPGNEVEFAKNPTFLGLLGKLLLLHHEHPARTAKQRNYDREEDADFGDSCSSLQGESEWWWDFLHHIRENALVTAANIAGHMDLGQYPEEISRPVLDGLLHWAVCPAAHGQDPFPTVSSSLSPQRLALEALCKLCVTENNVDLVIATPPYSRLERLCAVLTKLLCRGEEQVLREFAVNLLHYLAAADSGVARTVALQSPCVSLLVAFIEQAEASALGVANQHGIGALRDNPDSMGTSLDMLRRAAGTLLHLARHPDNRPLFLQQEQRLLALVMSQILDQQVASIISRVLFQCSRSLEHGNIYIS